MSGFNGFSDGKSRTLTVPVGFFTDVLPVIADVDELKLLFCFFRLLPAHQDQARFVFLDDLEEDDAVKASLPGGRETIVKLLEKACRDKVLLAVEYEDRPLYFLNTPRADAALRAIQKGVWTPTEHGRTAPHSAPARRDPPPPPGAR